MVKSPSPSSCFRQTNECSKKRASLSTKWEKLWAAKHACNPKKVSEIQCMAKVSGSASKAQAPY